MLSDVDSQVIHTYGVLNDVIQPDEVPFYGIPFPGFFLLDERGVIVDKLFNRHLANREGIESILDSFAGRVEPGQHEPTGSLTEDAGIKVTAFLRGGGGVLRIGPRRRLVVRFELADGLHIYGDPVPEGMVATQITIEGPDGFRCEALEAPPTKPLQLPGIDATLQVWDGTVDFVTPVYASSELTKVVRSEDPSIEVQVHVRYQACDDEQCFIPRTETITLEVPMSAGVMPGFKMMEWAGSGVIDMDSTTHMRRLIDRQASARVDGD
jgi:hypothetical protein